MALTIFNAEIAAKYGAPVYSRHPPITAIFPDQNREEILADLLLSSVQTHKRHRIDREH